MSLGLKILEVLLSVLGVGFCLWLIYRAAKRSESALKIILKGFSTIVLLAGELWLIHKFRGSLHAGGITANAGPAFFMIVSMAVVGVILSAIWTPHLGDLIGGPFGDLFDGGNQPPERRPLYSAAQSKRRQNKPLEAIVAIREQLAQFSNDFEGVMLLASIQAEDMEDLASAEMTINHFCNAPDVPDQQVIKALTRLADWHLNQGSDPDTVLEIMEKLMTRFPDAKISQRLAERLGRLQTDARPQKVIQEISPVISNQVGGRKYVSSFKNKTNRRN